MEVEYLKSDEGIRRKDEKPPIIVWKGVKMVKNHSIRAVANEIMNMSANQDLISINVIGKQSTGKTEICKTLSCQIHQMASEPYAVLHLGKKQLGDLEGTVANLKPMNHIIIFDDIAFLKAQMTNKQIDSVQSVLAEIRHLKGGDVRIIIFKCFQYSKAIPPFLRQNDMTFFSSVDENEKDSILATIGNHNAYKMNQLKKMQVQVKMGKAGQAYFHYPMGRKKVTYFKYHARNPFLPYLYYNGISARIIVSPLREWIDPVCSVCDVMEEGEDRAKDTQNIIDDFTKKFGNKRTAKAALRQVALMKGIDTNHKRTSQGIRYIEQFLDKKLIDMETLLAAFDLKETKTALRKAKQPEFVNPLAERDET